MKKRMKCLVAMGLVFIMSMGLIGCGSKEGSQGNQTSSGQSNVSGGGDSEGKSWEEVLAEMPSELRGTSITVYNWNPISEYPGGTAIIEQFTQQTGIEVIWKTEDYSTYLSKLTNMVASDEAPDVVRLRSPQVSNLLSMQPISVTGYDFTDAAWDSWTKDVYTIDGQCYGVNLANTPIASPSMILYNKALIDKYDLDDPYMLWKNGNWTYDKFVSLMRDYVAESGDDFAASYYDYSELTSVFGVNGPITFDGTSYVSQLDDSNFINATQKVADLVNTDYLLNHWAPDEFDAGKCLFWFGTAIHARMQNTYLSVAKDAGSLYAVPFPKAEGSEEYVLYNEVEAYGVPQGAKNAAAVPYFLRYFLDRVNYDMDAFFCSSQAVEVYDYCMGLKNKLWTTGYDETTNFYSGLEADEFSKQMKTATGSQIITVIDSTGPVIEQRVKRYNEQLTQIKE